MEMKQIFYLNLAIKLAIIIFGCYMGAKMGIFATLKKIFEYGKEFCFLI